MHSFHVQVMLIGPGADTQTTTNEENEMTHDEITAKINALTLKDGITVKYNFDKYGSTQVEIREESGSLIWRGWSFEADFALFHHFFMLFVYALFFVNVF